MGSLRMVIALDNVTDFMHDYCKFGQDRVYPLMAIARKNENKHLTKNSEIVFREVLKKPEDINRKVEKLQNAAQNYTGEKQDDPVFRLYMSVNARNTVDAYWNFRERMNQWIQDLMNGDDAASYKLKKIDSHWKSELQRSPSRDETLFLFDIDEPDAPLEDFTDFLEDYTDVVTYRETPNGFHVITETFNYNELPDEFMERIEDLKTDQMMFLTYLT